MNSVAPSGASVMSPECDPPCSVRFVQDTWRRCEVGVEHQRRQVVVGAPLASASSTRRSARSPAAAHGASGQHPEPGRAALAAQRERHVEDVRVDEEPPGAGSRAAISASRAAISRSRSGRSRRPVVGGHPGAARRLTKMRGRTRAAPGCGSARAPTAAPGRRPRSAPAATASRPRPRRRRCAGAGPGRGTACRGAAEQHRTAPGDVVLAERSSTRLAKDRRPLLAPGDGEHVRGVRPRGYSCGWSRSPSRLNGSRVSGHVGELRRVRADHGVEAGEQRPALRRAAGTEPGRLSRASRHRPTARRPGAARRSSVSTSSAAPARGGPR